MSYANDTALVSPAWAQEHLNDPNVRFVEVDVDTAAYEQSHLPGAVGWNWTSQLADGVRRDIASRRGPLEAAERVRHRPRHACRPVRRQQQLVRGMGVLAAEAARRRERQHPQRRPPLLAGQRPAGDHGRAVVRGDGHPAARAGLTRLRAFRDDILPRLGDAGFTLVDVRSPAEFSGEVIAPPGMTETAQRGGHIPGAQSIPWGQTVKEDGTFKDAPTICRPSTRPRA